MRSRKGRLVMPCGCLPALKLLLYIRASCSKRTAKLVQSHVAECSRCRDAAVTLMELRQRWRHLPARG